MIAQPGLVTILERHLGAERVLSDQASLDRYSRDGSSYGPFPPEVVVLPRSREEVAAVLRLSQEFGFPVTPRGAGTGLTGAALPVCGGAVLSLERMARIKEIDDESFTVTVEPGVVTGELQRVLEERGLFYPPDPASLGTCSIGGNVAHNAGGPRTLKYGVTRDYVLGLEVLLAAGTPLRTGHRTMKGVAGYDLTALLVGSEGTLGVTTEVTLRIIPAPKGLATLTAIFRDAVQAGQAVTEILQSGIRPRALELVDRGSIAVLRQHGNYSFPADGRTILLCELDEEPEALDRLLGVMFKACERAGAVELQQAVDAGERERLWAARRAVYPLLLKTYPRVRVEDVCVPRARIAEVLRRVDTLCARHGIQTATLAHAGDGNLHVALLHDLHEADLPAEERRREAMSADLLRVVLELGGTIAGEHGIGHAKRAFLGWELSPEMIALQQRLKSVFDPKHLLNPQKIF